MDVELTGEYVRDTRKLSMKELQRLDEIIKRISNSERPGKQLHYLKDVFSVRVENKRLIYQIKEKEKKVILLFFKSREDVYQYLR